MNGDSNLIQISNPNRAPVVRKRRSKNELRFARFNPHRVLSSACPLSPMRGKSELPQTNLRDLTRIPMKRLVCKLLLVVYLIPSIAFAQTNTDGHIKKVEAGLLPAVLIKGDPSWSIAERMKFYKAPGLSVAVIKDFQIDWARGYGVKDLATNEPVTTDTLFQA